MFGYHTVLYDISFTDLDEVSEAMQQVVDGLRFFLSGLQTLVLHDPETIDEQTEMTQKLEFINRQLQLVHTRGAAMLIEEGKDVPHIQFEKFNILKTGIALRFIPSLSEKCKKQLEGSFKIVEDDSMKELTSRGLNEEQDLNDNDRLIMRFFSELGNQPEIVIGTMTSMFNNINF